MQSRTETSYRDKAILIVEDEYYIADDVAKYLMRQGARVIGPVPSVDLALERLRAEGRIDLCILDINLDGSVSYAVADELDRSGVPFVFATGYDLASIPQRYHGAPRLEKPFEEAALDRIVATFAG